MWALSDARPASALVHIEGHLADCLHRIGVEDDLSFHCDRANLRNRLQDPDLVVGRHDGDENRLIRDGSTKLLQVETSVRTDRQVCDARALALEIPASVDDRAVLGQARDDVISFGPICLCDALMARLFDSVAPLVKTISFALAPMRPATWARAFSTASFEVQPNEWLRLAALPNFFVKYGSIASSTRGSTGVVAW